MALLPPELPLPQETCSSVCFSRSSSFQCRIPYLQSSAASPALFPRVPNEAYVHEPLLTLEKGREKSYWWSAAEGVFSMGPCIW